MENSEHIQAKTAQPEVTPSTPKVASREIEDPQLQQGPHMRRRRSQAVRDWFGRLRRQFDEPRFDTPSAEPPPDNIAESDAYPGLVHIRSYSLFFLALLGLFYTLYFAREILFPVSLAMVLTLLLRPPVRWLARRGVPYFVGAGLTEMAAVGIVIFGIYQLVQPAREWIADAPAHLARIEAKLKPVTASLESIKAASAKVENITDGGGDDAAVPVVTKEAGMASVVMTSTGAALATIAVTLVLLYFLLASGDTYLNKIVEMVPTFRGKRDAVEVARAIEWGVSSYLFTITIINACLGVVEGFAMWLLGVPNPALWGFMAAILNYIPFLGPLIGTVVVGLVALAEFDTIGAASVVPLVYLGITTIEGNFTTPAIFGRSMSLNPVMVIVSLTFWGWIWGIGGALLAVPFLAAAKIACDRLERLAPVGRFLGG